MYVDFRFGFGRGLRFLVCTIFFKFLFCSLIGVDLREGIWEVRTYGIRVVLGSWGFEGI